jgi:hypothetical protein
MYNFAWIGGKILWNEMYCGNLVGDITYTQNDIFEPPQILGNIMIHTTINTSPIRSKTITILPKGVLHIICWNLSKDDVKWFMEDVSDKTYSMWYSWPLYTRA